MRKTKLFTLLVAFAAMLMASCSKSAETAPQYIPFEDDDDNYGLINAKGEIILSGEFDDATSSVYEGVFTARENDGISVYKLNGKKCALVGDLEGLKAAGYMQGGIMPVVRESERIEAVNGSGKAVFTFGPVDNVEVVSCDNHASDGMICFETAEGKWGAYSTTGKLMIKPNFEIIGYFFDGVAVARKYSESGSDDNPWLLIDKKGEVKYKFKKGERPNYEPCGGYYITYNESKDRVTLVKANGTVIECPKKVSSVVDVNDKYYIFRNDDGKYGMARIKDHEVLVRAKYRTLAFLPWDDSNLLASDKDSEYFLVNTKGDKGESFNEDYDRLIVMQMADTYVFLARDSDSDEYFILSKDRSVVKTGVDISGLGDIACFSSTITSDYFDNNGFIHAIGEAFNGNSVRGIQIGQYANQYFPSSLTAGYSTEYRNHFNAELPEIEGYRYNIGSPTVYTEYYLATSEYVSGSYYGYGRWEYSFRPNNPVFGVSVTVSSSYPIWDKCLDEIKDLFKERGFKLTNDAYYSSESTTVMVNESKQVKLLISRESSGISLTLVNDKKTEEAPAEEAVAEEGPVAE